MGIIAWIVVGLIAGFIAKALMPGNEPGGIILTVLLGIAGAFVGGVAGFMSLYYRVKRDTERKP